MGNRYRDRRRGDWSKERKQKEYEQQYDTNWCAVIQFEEYSSIFYSEICEVTGEYEFDCQHCYELLDPFYDDEEFDPCPCCVYPDWWFMDSDSD